MFPGNQYSSSSIVTVESIDLHLKLVLRRAVLFHFYWDEKSSSSELNPWQQPSQYIGIALTMSGSFGESRLCILHVVELSLPTRANRITSALLPLSVYNSSPLSHPILVEESMQSTKNVLS